jgi:hypothetical protein
MYCLIAGRADIKHLSSSSLFSGYHEERLLHLLDSQHMSFATVEFFHYILIT